MTKTKRTHGDSFLKQTAPPSHASPTASLTLSPSSNIPATTPSPFLQFLKQSIHSNNIEMDRRALRHGRAPSFSSTLLDAIFRSIDDPPGVSDATISETKQSVKHNTPFPFVREELSQMVEKQKQNVVRRRTVRDRSSKHVRGSMNLNSSKSSNFSHQKLNHVRPLDSDSARRSAPSHNDGRGGGAGGGGFSKTKTRCSKIYEDLKKTKQPISPGARIASFLNSLFSSANSKKPKLSSPGRINQIRSDSKLKSTNNSSSSGSSFTRSCFSRTPSSRGKQRIVTFHPVCVILDEDRRCNHKCVCEDDDAESYASSDLFELENLASIGIARYKDELPVYGSTNLVANRSIVSGLI